MEPKFEVVIDGKVYVLPFVGYKRTHEFPGKTPIREQNYLFISSEHDFDSNEDSEELKVLIGGKEALIPEYISEISSGTEYYVLSPLYDWKEFLLKNGLKVVKESKPVLVCSNLKPEDVFSKEECAKYGLPEMHSKGNPMVVYDLIERKFVLMGDKEYNSLYGRHLCLFNGGCEISFLNEGKYRFLIETGESAVCYAEDMNIHQKNTKTYIDVTSLDNVTVVDTSEIDAFFCPMFEDLPEPINWINLSLLGKDDFFAYENIAKITPSSLGNQLSCFVAPQNEFRKEDVCAIIPAHIKDFLLQQIKSEF